MTDPGASLERQARAGHAGAVVILLTVAGVKLIAAVLPLLALRRRISPVRNRRARALAWTEAAVLTFYGVVYTGVGWLVQAGVIAVPATANHRALAWHTYLWDPWFLVWGLLVAGALLRSRPDSQPDAQQGANANGAPDDAVAGEDLDDLEQLVVDASLGP